MAIVIDEIKRSKRRTIGLEITPDSRLIIHAPLRVSKKNIEAAVLEKSEWILEKQQQARLRRERHPAICLSDGETVMLFGSPLTLKFDTSVKKAAVYGQSLVLPAKLRGAAQTAVTSWYKAQALEILTNRTDYYAERAGVQYESLRITSALTRWGSCRGRNLCFTWRLAMAPLEMVDYVVVHELSHITHPNHSTAFWRRVGELMPDYRERMVWFRENAALLRPDIFT